MRPLPAIFAVVTIVCAGCTSTRSTRIAANRASDYVPSFKRIRDGFRPIIPYYHAETTFWHCEYLSAAELGDIKDHFTRPLCEGRYYQHIGAIVINGSYESCQTTFTIWLLDGRRLDSGYLFFAPDGEHVRSDFNGSDLGRPMHRHALELLRRAIPESQLERAKNAKLAEPSS